MKGDCSVGAFQCPPLEVTLQASDVLSYNPQNFKGGDLFFHMISREIFQENEAKFYVGETLLAIEHLHELNILYRDLKPENIMLDTDGHAKLIDFGLSKENVMTNETTKSFCESPEMVKQKGVGRAGDMYAIGVLLYEMLQGIPPYFDLSTSKMYKLIEAGKLLFVKDISQNAKNLIQRLLNLDPNKRIGVNDKNEIKLNITANGRNASNIFSSILIVSNNRLVKLKRVIGKEIQNKVQAPYTKKKVKFKGGQSSNSNNQ